ncbi:MAG: UDP-N-acetylmuramoyl-tripeptide--D-alanyl-D-alanine ligase [Paludibacteraceae bacterium]|nr:UDP-N-acetylmuramoyl-tripeptide--D-alanyl-D-alanine ligase [Paludibacteraceae bacterium]
MVWNFLTKNNAINVSTDSRNLPAGCTFFALHGETFDGNKFAAEALAKGAERVVVDNREIFRTLPQDKAILVPDTLRALQELARDWRRELGIRVIGITGTNGKTTTKELTAAVLKKKYNLLYTQGNLNNSIGVPLTLLRMTREHDLALIEMGASHPGDITELVNICEPNCGLITNVGKAHLLGFGSFEGVMRTKKELYDYLALHGGFCFRNLDNPHLKKMAGNLETVGYHTGTMLSGTQLVGDYNSENIQAALCVGEYFGIPRTQGEAAIREYVPQNNRSQLLKTEKNVVIVDAYNANVTSMTAAIKAFNGDTLILGDMLELGAYSAAEHQNIVDLIREQGFTDVYLVGAEFGKTHCDFDKYTNADQLRLAIALRPITGKKILLKGSHGIHLEKIIEVL